MDPLPFSRSGILGGAILENICDPKNKIKLVIIRDSKKKKLLKVSQAVKILATKPNKIIILKNPRILTNNWGTAKILTKIELAKIVDKVSQIKNKMILIAASQSSSKLAKSKADKNKFRAIMANLDIFTLLNKDLI